ACEQDHREAANLRRLQPGIGPKALSKCYALACPRRIIWTDGRRSAEPVGGSHGTQESRSDPRCCRYSAELPPGPAALEVRAAGALDRGTGARGWTASEDA